MDPKRPELAKFTEQAGIQVKYQEVIQELGRAEASEREQRKAARRSAGSATAE
jgi:spermidine/putrescine transport system substrate-binding protein